MSDAKADIIEVICARLSGDYTLDQYMNEKGETGGFVARSVLDGSPIYHYDSDGDLLRKLDMRPLYGDPAQQGAATFWKKDLELKFPSKVSYQCRRT